MSRKLPTLVHILHQHATGQPDRRAFLFRERDKAIDISYGQLEGRVSLLAAHLAQKLARGERAVLFYPGGIAYLEAFLACLRAGIIAVPLYPPKGNERYDRIAPVLSDADPGLVLTCASLKPRIVSFFADSVPLPILVTDELDEPLQVPAPPMPRARDIAFLQYTSGSTGTPKGVVITHANLMANQKAIGTAFATTPDDVCVSWLPLFHDMGLIGTTLHALFRGFPCILLPAADFVRDPLLWLELIAEFRATLSGAPNFAYELCMRRYKPERCAQLDLSLWRVAFNGAEPVRAETLRQFAQSFAAHGFDEKALYPCYGLAEATLFVSGGPVGAGFDAAFFDDQALAQGVAAVVDNNEPAGRERVACGFARARHDIVIAVNGEDGFVRADDGCVGEIWVSGPSIAAGYWRNAELSLQVFDAHLADGGGPFLRTGDMGFVHEGNLFVSGRVRELLIIRGRNLFPQDIEKSAVAAHVAARPDGSAVFSYSHEGEEVAVLVQEIKREALRNLDSEAVVDALRAAISEQHNIDLHALLLVKPGAIPRTSSGKIRRAATRQAWLDGQLKLLAGAPQADSGTRDAPQLDKVRLLATDPGSRLAILEEFLCAFFAHALRRGKVRADVPLTALSLDSLSAVNLQHDLESILGYAPPATDLLDGLSPRQLARAILPHLERGREDVIKPVPLKAPIPMSFAQSRMWFLHRLAPGNPYYHVAATVRLRGAFHVRHLRDALALLVNRHAILRTTFRAAEQVIHDQMAVPFSETQAPTPDWDANLVRDHLRQHLVQPFDLSQGPLIRAHLLRFSEHEAALILTLHHIIIDGWSLAAVFSQELAALYAAVASQQPPLLPDPRLQYAHYAVWEQQARHQNHRDVLRAWWHEQLSGVPATTALHPDHPRPAVPSYRGAVLPVLLSGEALARLDRLAADSGCTLFTVLLAAFKVLLFRRTGQKDLVLGAFSANRDRAELAPLLGFFANILPLRSQLDDSQSGTDLLVQVRRSTLQAQAHGNLPFDMMVEGLDLPRDPARHPLLQWIVVQQQAPPRELVAGDVRFDPLPGLDWGTVRFDGELHLWRGEDSLSGALVYAEDLFEAATMRALLADWFAVLDALATAPDAPLPKVGPPPAGPGPSLAAIRAVAMNSPLVAECAVRTRSTPLGRHEAVLYVVPRGRASMRALHRWLAERFEHPPRIVPIRFLPLDDMGRLQPERLDALEVLDDKQASAWEAWLGTSEAVDEVAVVVGDAVATSHRHHLWDLLPRDRRKQGSDTPGYKLALKKGEPVALADGPPLVIPEGSPRTLTEALVATAERFPEKGLVLIRPNGEEARLSYPELLDRARRALGGLRRQGVKPGQALILQMADLGLHLPIFWAGLLGGFHPVTIAVPPHYDAGHAVVRKLLNTWNFLKRPVIVAGPSEHKGLQDLGIAELPVLDVTELFRGEPEPIDHPQPESIAFYQLTSGSTGMPKVIRETHRGIIAHIHAVRQQIGYTSDDICLNWLPMDHVVPILTCHLKDTYLGCTQIQVPTATVLSDPLRWPALMDRFRADYSWAPNFGFKLVNKALEQAPVQDWDLSHVKYLMNAGEQVTASVITHFTRELARYGLRSIAVQPAFGMAELCTCTNYRNDFSVSNAVHYFARVTPRRRLKPVAPDKAMVSFVDLGPPTPGVSVRIVDEDNQLLPELAVGRLQYRGPVVTPGYLDNDEANAEAFPGDGWFNSGDLGFIFRGCLTVTGREKETIIINGANHYCYEIEDLISETEGVLPTFAAACSIRAEDSGSEALAVFFSPRDAGFEAMAATAQRIKGHLGASLGITPVHVLPVAADVFPKTTSGKIQRTRLKKDLLSGDFDALQKKLDLHLGGERVLPDHFFVRRWRERAAASQGAPLAGVTLLLGDHLADIPAVDLVRVSTGPDLQRLTEKRYRINPDEPSDWRNLLVQLDRDGLFPENVVHTAALTVEAMPLQRGNAITLELLYFLQALAEVHQARPVRLWLITHGACELGEIEAHKAMLTSLLQSAEQEWSWLRCRLIDLPPLSPDSVQDCLAREFATQQGELEVAWQGDRRLVPRLARLERDQHLPSPLSGEAVYLVIGGSGGIGRTLVRFLCEVVGARVMVTGRRPASEVAPFPERVAYVQADVRRADALSHAWQACRELFGDAPIGVFHLGGHFQPRALLEESAEGLRAAMAAKVSGTLALHQAVEADGSRAFIVYFSSVNGSFAGAGSGAYAAANRFQDAFAAFQRARGLRSWSLGFSQWQGVGMSKGLGPESSRLAEMAGFRALSEREGMIALQAMLHRPPGLYLIGLDASHPSFAAALEEVPLQARVLKARYTAVGEAVPSIEDARIPDPFGTPTRCLLERVERLPHDARGRLDRDRLPRGAARAVREAAPTGKIEQEVAQIWREVLGLAEVGLEDNFFELGGHSLLLSKLNDRINAHFSVDIGLMDMFHFPTVATLAAHIGSLGHDDPIDEPQPVPVAMPQSDGAVAIIGMACRFPDADSPDLFWRNLIAGHCSITSFQRKGQSKDHVPAGAPLGDVSLFDAAFFSFSRGEAELLDPQHRMFLECSWEALESAGYNPLDHPGRTGVFAGSGVNTYLLNQIAPERPVSGKLDHFRAMLANDKDYLATRVAYKLNLQGPALSVQTACSTSLVAVHQASRALFAGDCEMALAGGVSIRVPQDLGYEYHEGLIFAPEAACRTFDAKAAGTVPGNGAGAVLLKPLARALADGDRVLAVIRGSAINNDGSQKAGFTAPGVAAQEAVISAALDDAGISPESIGYLEAHGTGTVLGDPIEINGLTRAWRRFSDRKGFCALGSVKTNLGHLDTAAGVAGLIKCVLSLMHRRIPPSLNFDTPNPHIDFAGSPFFVVTEARDWPAPEQGPRRCGLSSFGIGGTNAHVILEEAPELPSVQLDPPPHLMLSLSAKSEGALRDLCASYAAFLARDEVDAADLCFTANTGRARLAHRIVMHGHDREDLARAASEGRFAEGHPTPGRGRPELVVVLGELPVLTWLRAFPVAAAFLDELPGGASQDDDAAQAQFARAAALLALCRAWGLVPDGLWGYGAGLFAAAHGSGLLSLDLAAALAAALDDEAVATPELVLDPARIPLLDPATGEPVLPGATVGSWLDQARRTDAFPDNGEVHLLDLSACDSLSAFYDQVARAYVAGFDLVWSAFHQGFAGKRCDAPRYPFQRQSFWLEQGDAEMAPSDSRFDRILAELHARIAGVLETDISEIDVHEDFLEMGADSIVLVDAIQGIETTYGMKVSIRQLFEETTNLSALAAYIDENLPEDRSEDVATSTPIAAATSAPVPPSTPAPPQQPAPQVFVSPTAPQVPPQPVAAQPVAAQPVAAQPAAPQYAPPPAVAPQHPVSINGLEGFLQQQLETVSRTLSGVVGQQLALLGQQAIAPQAPVQQSVSAPVASPPSQPETPAPVQAQAPASARVEQPAPPQPPAQPSPPAASQAPASASEEEAPRAYHPYRMLKADTSDKADIDARQTAHREALIERFVARTKASRESVRQARPFLADSRAAMGFRFSTKEMLYPLTGSVSKGSRVLDLDGNEYIDITMGQGVDLLGHQPDFVQRALEDQLAKGIHLNPRWEELGEYARLLCELTGMDRVALTNSGTEAVMTAMRLARNATGRRKIVIFEGSYHGHSDGTLAASPGLGSDHAIPVAPGTPPGAVEDVIILPYGTDESLAEIRRLAPQLAAVLAEPVQSRFPDLQPREFLHQVRAITREHGALMVFDEMLTGFRSNLGGAQVVYGIQVDLATYGKVIGGGMPIGAVAGRGAIMDGIDGGLWDFGDRSYPAAERVFFGGTFCFHPLAMAGGLATLRYLRDAGPSLQEELNRKTALLVGELNDFFRAGNVPIHIATFGSLFRFMFKTNLDLFFYHLLEKGIYLWEGRNCFLSTAHSDADIAHIKEAIMATVEDLYEGGYLPTATLTPRDRPRDPLWPPLPDFQLKVQGASLEGRRIATRTKQLERAGGDAPARGFWERHRGAERPLPNMNLPERHGIDFSLFYFGTYPSEASPNKYNLLLDGARFGDANDFRAVWVPERHFHSFGGFSPNPSVVCAALARETQRLRLRAGSVVLPLHHPVRVAEEWAVVDNLSGGRVDISFASGWHPDDFVFAPENFGEHRELMFSEIDTVRRLWQGESVVAEGGNGARVDLTLHPMPIQKDLQTWITIVNNPDTYARAGAIGSGVLTNLLGQSLDELTSNIARYRHELEQAGLDPAQGHVTVMLHTFIGPDAELAIEQARQPFYDYLLNCVGLFENLVKTLGFKIDPANLAEDDRAFLLEQAYNRYVQDAALIGSPESCAPIIERILAAGADEIACFIDFGVDPDLAAAALPDLNRLRAMFADRKRGERPAAPPKSVPMSEAQRQLWVLRRLSQAADMAYTDPVRLHLRGPIDAAVMNRAVNTVVARHEALRARLNGEEPDWLVHERLSHPLPLIDLRGMDNGATSWFEQESACPIDLVGQGPLRTALLRLADDEHILAVRTHHILVDGWSAAVILDELRACYDALVRGRLPDLPEPIDFSAFQARRDASLAEESMIAQRSWWRDQLGSRPPHTVLPDDFSRGANKSWSGGRFSRQLNARETAAIKQLARAHRCTPFMASMTLFGGLVSRLTGQERVLIGLPVAGRSAAEGCMIGYFTHLLPVQLDMPGSATAAELLDRTRRSLLAAFDHQDYPFAQLIRDLELTQSGPLVSMTFNMDQPIHLPNLACLDTRILPETIQYARFDFSINITEIDGCYALAFDYSKEAYEDDTAVRWANRFHHLLHGVLADPHGPLAAISMADESELSLLLSRFNDTATEPPGQTLHMRLAELAERLGDTVALVDALTGDETSFSQLHHQALAQAALLREQGIRPGQVVAILMDRSPEAIVAMLATLHCGAAYLPLDPAMPISRLRFMLLDAGAALIQTSSYHQGQAEDIAEGLPILWVIGTGDGFSLPGVPEQSAYIMYTSGSTGQPKGVMVPHAAITRLVHDPGYIQVSEGDVFLGHAPMSFDAATFEIWAPLFHGARLVILPQRIPSLDELVDALTRFQVTWLWLPAALFSLLASRPAPAGHRPRAVFTGGEAMSPAALAMCRNNWPGMRIVNIYGPTENTTFSTWFDTEGWDTRHVSVPIGSPIGDTSAYVVTPDLRPAVAGDGELWLGGVGLASGYLGRPALTAERFVPHPFSDQPGERLYRSGDLVRFVWHQERPVIEFRGRADRQVKLRGFRIELDEIAATLERNPGVAQSAVTLDLSAKSPRLVAYVVPSAGDLEAKHLSLWLADHLPEYMVPGHYVALDRLPLNARGKLDRDALPAPEPDDAERQGTPPANRLEREMAEIWAEVLDTDQIFRESNFFELGGHSLTATRVVSRIKERFGLELSLADFFATPFISDLAANVLAAGGTLQVTQADQDLEREEIEI